MTLNSFTRIIKKKKWIKKRENERLYIVCFNDCGDLRNDESVFYCVTDAQSCFCLGYGGGNCTSSWDCSFEKAFAKLVETASVSYCALCAAIFRRNLLPVYVDGLNDCVLPTPFPTPSIISDTFEKWSDRSDCTAACVLLEAGSSLYDCSDGDDSCLIEKSTMPYSRCTKRLFGEACVFFGEYSYNAICASCAVINRRVPKPV